ncbi:MAG: HlyD family secretion protein [Anaerolineae bacterium]
MRRAVLVVAFLGLVAGGYYWWNTHLVQSTAAPETESTSIRGTGTIEADAIDIMTQVTGRIALVNVDVGDTVRQGEVLLVLDATDLQAQEQQALAALEVALAKLASASAPPRAEAVAAAEAAVEQARVAREGAEAVWQKAQEAVTQPLALEGQVRVAEGRVAMLEAELEAAKASLQAAEIRRDEAQRRQTNDEETTNYQIAEKQVLAAQANLAAVQVELDGAREQVTLLVAMCQRPVAQIVAANAAESAYRQAVAAQALAEAKLAAVLAGPRPEDVAVAQAEVQQAKATLARVRVQLQKLTITAPSDGVILARAANVGELALPGVTLMTLGRLEHVSLRLFVAEADIGRLQLGQVARVYVDAYPGETFLGTLTYISSQAEFTPKNVQAREERAQLVFAVSVSLDNSDRRLKPGMPGDAEIIVGQQ